MIRLCPNCNTERPLTEIFCEGTVDAHNCGWDLSAVDITLPGMPAPKPQPIPTPVRGPACRNGHENSPGDLVCSVCGEPVEERPAESDAGTGAVTHARAGSRARRDGNRRLAATGSDEFIEHRPRAFRGRS